MTWILERLAYALWWIKWKMSGTAKCSACLAIHTEWPDTKCSGALFCDEACHQRWHALLDRQDEQRKLRGE